MEQKGKGNYIFSVLLDAEVFSVFLRQACGEAKVNGEGRSFGWIDSSERVFSCVEWVSCMHWGWNLPSIMKVFLLIDFREKNVGGSFWLGYLNYALSLLVLLETTTWKHRQIWLCIQLLLAFLKVILWDDGRDFCGVTRGWTSNLWPGLLSAGEFYLPYTQGVFSVLNEVRLHV